MAVDPNERWGVEVGGSLVGRQATAARTFLARLLGVRADDRTRMTTERSGWWLGRLPEGWFVFHDVPVGHRGANIDHVVIGPAGVFTVNTRYLFGKIVVYQRSITHEGVKTDYLSKATAEAGRAARLLTTAIGRTVQVRGVLAILADEWTIVEEPPDVIVRGPRGAKNLMLKQPSVLRPSDVIVLAAAASKPDTWTLRSDHAPLS
jgi:Nuclease-related domain